MNRTARNIRQTNDFYERTRASLESLALKAERISRLPLIIRFFFVWHSYVAACRLRHLLGDMLVESGMPVSQVPTFSLIGFDFCTRSGALRLASAFRQLALMIENRPDPAEAPWLVRALDDNPFYRDRDGLLTQASEIANLLNRLTTISLTQDRIAVLPTCPPSASDNARPEVRLGQSPATSRKPAALAAY